MRYFRNKKFGHPKSIVPTRPCAFSEKGGHDTFRALTHFTASADWQHIYPVTGNVPFTWKKKPFKKFGQNCHFCRGLDLFSANVGEDRQSFLCITAWITSGQCCLDTNRSQHKSQHVCSAILTTGFQWPSKLMDPQRLKASAISLCRREEKSIRNWRVRIAYWHISSSPRRRKPSPSMDVQSMPPCSGRFKKTGTRET
jgi:hypothetical protein